MGLKLEVQVMVKTTPEMRDALTRIAAAKAVEVPELLRRAGYAIIEYALANGDKAVPLDMEICPVGKPSASHLQVAEELYKIIKADEKKKKS